MFDGSSNKRQPINAFDVEFEEVTVTPQHTEGERNLSKKAVSLKKIGKISDSAGIPIVTASSLVSDEQKAPYSYDFDSSVLITCKIENWGRGVSIFSEFVKDAKKYYKKTCLNAKYIYFFSYRPTYKEMTHEQLCWYLYWRSSVRGGQYIKTGLTYIFLYLYEQINLCDIIGVEKAYGNIINIWKNYRAEFPRIDKYIAEWLIDFSLIHKIKINLDEIENILPTLLNTVTLPEIYLQDDYFKKEIYVESFIKSVSAYDYKKSKFYELNREVFDLHVPKIVHTLLSSPEFKEIFNEELENGVKIKATRESYSGAVCTYEHKWKITVEYKNAYKNSFFRQCLTDIIRSAENILREYSGIKSRLPISAFPDKLRRLIKEYQNQYLPPKIQQIKPKKVPKTKKIEENADTEIQVVEFNANIEAASEIEKQSWGTTITLVELQERDSGESKAVVDEIARKPSPEIPDMMTAIDTNDTSFEDYGDMSEIADEPINTVQATPNNDDSEVGAFAGSLNEMEYKALVNLINSNQDSAFEAICAGFLNETGIMLESVIDEINGKALDFIGDVIFDLNAREIIGEYKRDLIDFFEKN